MKNCIKCNAELLDNALFCPSCGEKQEPKIINLNIKGKEIKKVSEADDDFFTNSNKEKTSNIDIKEDKKSVKENEPQIKDDKQQKEENNTHKKAEIKEEQSIKKENKKQESSDKKNILSKKKKININKFEYNEKKITYKELNEIGIIDFEIIDESILIDDPFHSKFDVKEVEKQAQQTDKVKEATEIIKEISFDEKCEKILYPILSPNVYGFRCIITGNEGTKKEPSIQKIADALKIMGKIETNEIVRFPFGNMPEKFESNKLYVVTDLKTAIERLFNLEDFSDEANILQRKFVMYMERLLTAPLSTYIILDGYATQIKGFMSLDPRIRYIFSSQIEFPDLSNEEIYKIFYNELPDYHKKQLPEVFEYEFIKYLERNKRFFPFNNEELGKFLAQASSKEAEFKLPPEKYNSASLDTAFSRIIGMKNVKDQIKELQQFLQARKELEEAGATLPAFHMHMMFLGNPGVGKTTIARIIAKILFDLGYIREEKLIEVTSKDLVGNGNLTGIKTNRAILSALGGVLFIDEAYSLSNSSGQAGAESITHIIKAMEDYKNDLVVMLAGYTLEMNDFVKSNSGIASRIAYTFTFHDYSDEELFEIFKLKAKMANMQIHPAAEAPIRNIIKWGSSRKNFGNGRYIDKLFQRTLTKHATLNLPKKEILIIKKESIPTVEEIMQTFGKFMGQ